MVCVNTEARTDPTTVIGIDTTTSNGDIYLNNSGQLIGGAYGIDTYASSADSSITIVNTGDITISSFSRHVAIHAVTRAASSPINISNFATLNVTTSIDEAYGIRGKTYGSDSNIFINNRGDLNISTTGSGGRAVGIYSYAEGPSTTTIINSGALKINSVERGYGIYAASEDDGGAPLIVTNSGPMNVVAVDTSYGIYAGTEAANSSITVTNTGTIRSTSTDDDAWGIQAEADSDHSPVSVTNSGAIFATAPQGVGVGVEARAFDDQSPISIFNSGAVTVMSKLDAYGLVSEGHGDNSPTAITNTGALTVTSTNEDAAGIYASSDGIGSPIQIVNSGNLNVWAGDDGTGISAYADDDASPISIMNSGAINVTAVEDIDGIYARTNGMNSSVEITNHGAMSIDAGEDADGIDVEVNGANSPVRVVNTGALTVTSRTANANGIEIGSSYGYVPSSNISVNNSGALVVRAAVDADGIDTEAYGGNSTTTVVNSGAITVTAVTGSVRGIESTAYGINSPVSITNSGDIHATATKGTSGPADGIFAATLGPNSAITVVNSAAIMAKSPIQAVGIRALSYGAILGPAGSNSPISITNSGDIRATVTSTTKVAFLQPYNYAMGLLAVSTSQKSPIAINNSGSVYAEGGPRNVGVYAYSVYANKTTITNTGEIGAQSHLAIDVKGGGAADIFNAGLITGFVDLTAQNDRFVNQAGGVFETKKTSLFGAGNDLFVNQSGGTVLAATDGGARETSGFQGLETFKNRGLISMIDGGVGDRFTIANTPGGKNLNYEGGGLLGVDAFLGGPGSKADVFTVQGNVSGVTKVVVNNTNTGPGTFNSQGIPVVFVDGKTPNAGNFVLRDGPIDTGFFDYDLFFTPTGSGYWEFRSFAGGGAYILPKLLTAAQDIWHETSSTWFDRTADLRVVLNGGGSPAYDAGTKAPGGPASNGLTPGAWIKGGGARLNRDASATTNAYGNSYTFDLDGQLDTIDLQMGIDMGRYDVLSEGDALIFGVLGGFVGGNLDYDALVRSFDFSGGQVGAYATYLKGGLFVDTLLNVHLYEIDAPNQGFPDSLNATTVGLRTDSGYRFGSFTGGAFFEPLATIEVTWADIDGFNVGGNKVSFSDDANVRGRLGARAGTTMQAWEGTMMEPFVIASLWGNLSDENSATLVSNGRTFQFNDDLQDVWGELSAGVNLFNFSQTTSVFAKVDYTFGEDISGVGGKAGMRVSW